MLKNKTRAHAPEPKMATVEKHAPRNYVAFKNIKSLKEKLKEELKEFKELKHILQHVETHIDGLSYDCPLCNKSFRSTNAFYAHKSRSHKNIIGK